MTYSLQSKTKSSTNNSTAMALNLKSEIDVDFSKTCRVCMSESTAMKWLFQPGVKIAHQIEYCTGIIVEDDSRLPTSICLNCYARLRVSYDFKTSFISVNESFLHRLKYIKYEPIETIEVGYEDVEMSDDESNHDTIPIENEDKPDHNVERPDQNLSRPNSVKIPDQNLKLPDCNVKGLNEGKTAIDVVSLKNIVSKDVTVSTLSKRKQPGSNKPPKKCNHCKLEFKNIFELRAHHKETHKQGPWTCEHCSKLIFSYSTYYSHIRAHLPAKFFCDKCDYKTPTKLGMLKHLKIHTGERNYPCKMCDQKYIDSSRLYRHVQSCHTKVKNIICDRCGMEFHTKDKLRKHIYTHDRVKRHQCYVCHTFFSRPELLRKHLQKKHSTI